MLLCQLLCVAMLGSQDLATPASPPLDVGGVYPHLAVSNAENECGIGAVVPWAGKLWVITYAPHKPNGSSDRLYSITGELDLVPHPASVGGTPANRMIHMETRQLLIGPYVIRETGEVRVIPPAQMFGRLTGTARHLVSPGTMAYYATMEEGLYEVDLETLEVNCLIRDGNRGAPEGGVKSNLPGYHGKGLYSGQGRLVYANNGEHGRQASIDPTTESGALATWDPETGGEWALVRRNQFTEVTGPSGLLGSPAPDSDSIWTMGWDARSLILGVLEGGAWSYFRLPKASHSYDGAHGWNTEWPRIRDVGQGDELLATMHGTFWSFPRTFRMGHTGGLRPRTNYLKVIGDFCAQGERIVLGCDDSAKAEFLNKRPFKSEKASPLESNSNLWFVAPERLDALGPVIGRGSVWLRDDLPAGSVSDPYLFAGYDHRQLYLAHSGDDTAEFAIEVDRAGTGRWATFVQMSVEPGAPQRISFDSSEVGEWVRVKSLSAVANVTAHFQYRDVDPRNATPSPLFDGIQRAGTTGSTEVSRGVMRSLAHDRLGLLSFDTEGNEIGYYELGPDLKPMPSTNAAGREAVRAAEQPAGSYQIEGRSVLVIEDGKRYRLPLGRSAEADVVMKNELRARVCREVATERDLLNVAGTVFELPARNASGVAKIRPVATHGLAVHDFCSHAGLLFMTGISGEARSDRIFRSDDGRAAVWAGVIDELWSLGKPRGDGGPWTEQEVAAGDVSDRYLMTGYEEKSAMLLADADITIELEVDVDGTDLWLPYGSYELKAGVSTVVAFPRDFSAYWIRAKASHAATATVNLSYR